MHWADLCDASSAARANIGAGTITLHFDGRRHTRHDLPSTFVAAIHPGAPWKSRRRDTLVQHTYLQSALTTKPAIRRASQVNKPAGRSALQAIDQACVS